MTCHVKDRKIIGSMQVGRKQSGSGTKPPYVQVSTTNRSTHEDITEIMLCTAYTNYVRTEDWGVSIRKPYHWPKLGDKNEHSSWPLLDTLNQIFLLPTVHYGKSWRHGKNIIRGFEKNNAKVPELGIELWVYGYRILKPTVRGYLYSHQPELH